MEPIVSGRGGFSMSPVGKHSHHWGYLTFILFLFSILAVTALAADGHPSEEIMHPNEIVGNTAMGGNDYPNAGIRLIDTLTLDDCEYADMTAVLDESTGYAYFCTSSDNNRRGKIIKVFMGEGNTAPLRIGELLLEEDEPMIHTILLDPLAGYGYVTVSGRIFEGPLRVIKFSLGKGDTPPSRIGAITFDNTSNAGANAITSVVIDSGAGYAYFASFDRLYKVALGTDDELPRIVGSIPFLDGWVGWRYAIIDPNAGYAYFTSLTSENPVLLAKIALGEGDELPTCIGTIELFSSEKNGIHFSDAEIDTEKGYGYFFTADSSNRFIKVALGEGATLPYIAGSLSMSENIARIECSAIDSKAGYAYLGTRNPGQIIKVSLGEGDTPPSQAGIYTVGDSIRNILFDPLHNNLVARNYHIPSRIIKMKIEEGDAAPTYRSELSLHNGPGGIDAGVFDETTGAFYSVSESGSLVKTTAAHGENSAVISVTPRESDEPRDILFTDGAGGYIYVMTMNEKLAKYTMGDENTFPTRVGECDLGAFVSAKQVAWDPLHGYAYLGIDGSPGKVLKIDPGQGNTAPVVTSELLFDENENHIHAAVINPVTGCALFAVSKYDSYELAPDEADKLIQIALGEGDAAPVRLHTTVLPADEPFVTASLSDFNTGYAYLCTSALRYDSKIPAKLVKIDIGMIDTPPLRIGAISLGANENAIKGAIMDSLNGYAWLVAECERNIINSAQPEKYLVKINLNGENDLPQRMGFKTINAWENVSLSISLDSSNGQLYMGTHHNPGQIKQMSVSTKGCLNGTKVTLPESGKINQLSLYSHIPAGNFRLALYDTGAIPKLLWQSGVISNEMEEGWLEAPISQGTPAVLSLSADDYWLVWQSDTMQPVADLSIGVIGDGFYAPFSFGEAPQRLDTAHAAQPILSDERWGAFISYDTVPQYPGVSAITADSITWTWDDNFQNEISYSLWEDPGDALPVTLHATLEANTTSWRHEGLIANTLYTFQVAATTYLAEEARSLPYSAWTHAHTPGAPTFPAATTTSLQVVLNSADGNPPDTEYALQFLATGQWVQEDDRLGDTPAWKTISDWATVSLTELAPSTYYECAAVARNHDGVITPAGPSGGSHTLTIVPDLMARSQSEAEVLLSAAGLVSGEISHAYHAILPAGQVIAQGMPAGTATAVHSTIDLTLSMGPQPISVPDLTGKTMEEAAAALNTAGLTLGAITEQFSDTIPAGRIISQAPVSETEVTVGTVIQLVLSKGPEHIIEGEGETPIDTESARATLRDNWEQGDQDHDGRLSFAEAGALIAGMSRSLFDSLDTNQDGFLSQEELESNEDPVGCFRCSEGKKRPIIGLFSQWTGDLFLVGLSLMALSVVHRNKR